MSLAHDPVEDTPEFQRVVAAIDVAADEATTADGYPEPILGRCHLFWRHKQRLLRERHGIEWRTPAQMNIAVIFD